MLGAKTILLAATVALALGQSDAAAESRLRVRIHGKGSTCGSGQSPMSVEGVEGVFCVSGQSCVADIDGSCPGEQTGLPYGSYCGIVKTGVHGCMPYTEPQGDSADSAECGDGESPMSVEGVEGIFCVSGQACVADINGACPGVQDGLPYGSSCGIVKTGVHGCKPNSRHHHHKKHHHKGTTCASGQSEMSVEGVEGIFCVSGQSCVADIDGSCPGEQTGLPYGSYCGIVKTGVHGCMPYTEPQSDSDDSDDSCADGESPMSVEGVEGIFCVTGQACVADINGTCPGVQDGLPYGSSCGIVKTGVHGCKPNSRHHHHHHHKSHHKGTTCASGQSEMSVEGVEGIFCVSGQSCVADIDGSCPGEQTGLPYGSYCGIVKTGVHGCMPYTEPQSDSDDSDDSCADGESPMSVEGVEGIFCVTGQACVADINGTCPGVQDGLPYGSSCGIVKTGVHGCKPNNALHHRKHKSHHDQY